MKIKWDYVHRDRINLNGLIFGSVAFLTIVGLPQWQSKLGRKILCYFLYVFFSCFTSPFSQQDILHSCIRRLTTWSSLTFELCNVRSPGEGEQCGVLAIDFIQAGSKQDFSLPCPHHQRKEREKIECGWDPEGAGRKIWSQHEEPPDSTLCQKESSDYCQDSGTVWKLGELLQAAQYVHFHEHSRETL